VLRGGGGYGGAWAEVVALALCCLPGFPVLAVSLLRYSLKLSDTVASGQAPVSVLVLDQGREILGLCSLGDQWSEETGHPWILITFPHVRLSL
jgi:hypothetical protein